MTAKTSSSIATRTHNWSARASCVIGDAALKPLSVTTLAKKRDVNAWAGAGLLVAIIALLLNCVAVARAQDAVPPVTGSATNYPVSTPAPAMPTQTNATAEPGMEPVETVGAQPYSPQPRRFQYGLLFRVRGVYDDNINISQFNPISDYYFAIEPTVTLGLGDVFEQQENYIRLDYTPSVFLFLDHAEDDAVQHLIRLEGHHRFRRLDLVLAQNIQILDSADLVGRTDTTITGNFANLDVSTRTRVNIFATQLKAAYEITGKTSLSTALESTITDYPDFISSRVISGDLFVNYAYSEKITVGVGGTAGYDSVDEPDTDQTFEQANLRLSYQATGKISFDASGGVEFRQFEQSSRGTYISPVFQIDGTYQPFPATSFSLAVSRRTLNSAVLIGEDFASTTVALGARQRFFQRAYLGFNIGYQNSDYFSTISGFNANRNDNYYFIQPSLDVMITRFWSVGGYYLHRQDDSSVDVFSFDNNQIGFRTVLTF